MTHTSGVGEDGGAGGAHNEGVFAGTGSFDLRLYPPAVTALVAGAPFKGTLNATWSSRIISASSAVRPRQSSDGSRGPGTLPEDGIDPHHVALADAARLGTWST